MAFGIDLELEKAVQKIQTLNAQTVCVQLPDGLKPKAQEIQEYLQEKTNATITFWAGTCFGACDLPKIDHLGFDLLIAFGHSEWR